MYWSEIPEDELYPQYISSKIFHKYIPANKKLMVQQWYLEAKEHVQCKYNLPIWIRSDDGSMCYHWYLILKAFLIYHPIATYNIIAEFIESSPNKINFMESLNSLLEIPKEIKLNDKINPLEPCFLGKRYVYIMKDCALNVYKIGVSQSPNSRLKQLQTSNAHKLELIYTIERGKDAIKVETELHKLFIAKNISGEWYKLDESDIESIKLYSSTLSEDTKYKFIDFDMFESMCMEKL
jgi:hypothetical protein